MIGNVNWIRATCAIGACLVVAACASVGVDRNLVSPSELLAQSSRYEGKEVVVVGWIESGFERHRIWDSETAYKQGQIERQCVGLSVPVGMATDSMDKMMVSVRGRFVRNLPDNVIAVGRCNNRASIYVIEQPVAQ